MNSHRESMLVQEIGSPTPTEEIGLLVKFWVTFWNYVIVNCCHFFNAVAKWSVTGQGVKNTK